MLSISITAQFNANHQYARRKSKNTSLSCPVSAWPTDLVAGASCMPLPSSVPKPGALDDVVLVQVLAAGWAPHKVWVWEDQGASKVMQSRSFVGHK